MSDLVDLAAAPPPGDWGVIVDEQAIASLADRWADNVFPLPSFDYPGTPARRDESWWFDYVVLATSVLACLWPPEGDAVWQTQTDQGDWVDDAPAIFAAFTRTLGTDGFDVTRFAALDRGQGRALFAGRGTLQLIDERVEILRAAAGAILHRWDGSAGALVSAAGRNGHRIAQLLTETVPGYDDRPNSPVGVLPFDKLAHLAAALMAAGCGWSDAGFNGYDDFPVYPDYMLPRVFRHHGVFVYSPELARQVDRRQLVPADSPEEHAIRWATVHAGAALRRRLHERNNPVTAPALDYHLWSEAVLGPDADRYGEHHRTLTLRY